MVCLLPSVGRVCISSRAARISSVLSRTRGQLFFPENYNGQSSACEILLVSQFLVIGNQDFITFLFCSVDEFSVCERFPSSIRCRIGVMTSEVPSPGAAAFVVKQTFTVAHRCGTLSGVGYVLQYGLHFPFIHWVEPFHEFLYCSSTLQVLEEGVYRQPGSGEQPVATVFSRNALHAWARAQSIMGWSPSQRPVPLCGISQCSTALVHVISRRGLVGLVRPFYACCSCFSSYRGVLDKGC